MVFLGFSYPRPSNDTFICVSILFCSCCGFSLVCKKLLFCRKNARGGSFLPHCQLDLLQFLNLRLFALFCDFFAQIFARTSVASKQAIPVFSRARVAKRNRPNSGKLLGSEIRATNRKSVSSCRFLDRMNIGAKKSATLEGPGWFWPLSHGFPMVFPWVSIVCCGFVWK